MAEAGNNTSTSSRREASRAPSAQALSSLISPKDGSARISAHHTLIWAAFAGGPDRTRDFLWREEPDNSFLTLSSRVPTSIDLFEPCEPKIFAPILSVGDRLSFALRANATRAKSGAGRVDVVMDALHEMPQEVRAGMRMNIAQHECAAWLARQGAAAGFSPLALSSPSQSVMHVLTGEGLGDLDLAAVAVLAVPLWALPYRRGPLRTSLNPSAKGNLPRRLRGIFYLPSCRIRGSIRSGTL